MTGKLRSQKGFTLLELMISMFILIILLSVAIPTYHKSVQQARETVLKENLWQMRRAIDPILETTEWDEEQGPDPTSSEGEEGLINVKSTAPDTDSEGKAYSDY